MGYRARDSFISYVGGTGRLFKKGDPVPDDVAAKVLALTYDDRAAIKSTDVTVVETGPAKPRKRAAKKSTD